MRPHPNIAKSFTSAALSAVLAGTAVHAQEDQGSLDEWSEMRGEVVGAEELLGADVSNGLNPVGTVTDLVLSADGSRVEYVLYETPYPWSFYGAEDGFATFDNVTIEHGASLDVDLVLNDAEAAQAPEELELTSDQARQRLVSRLIGEPMHFSGETEREIETLLIDRDTGAVTHYVVETDPDTLFRTARRTVPADSVTVDEEGVISASMQLAELEDVQEYDSTLL
ncbi:MAG: hypothetical protein JXB36_11425 [Gammaproteobacteria bacterium]|nr:hypothetical protein [Gammaproteobacteria bacterium]